MATATEDMDAEHSASLGRRYLIRFEDYEQFVKAIRAGRLKAVEGV